MADEIKPERAKAAPEAVSDVITIREYAEAQKLRPWQVHLLRDRLGLDKSMAAKDIADALDKFSKEAI